MRGEVGRKVVSMEVDNYVCACRSCGRVVKVHVKSCHGHPYHVRSVVSSYTTSAKILLLQKDGRRR